MALWVLLGVVTLLECGCGIAALTTGRIWVPWARHRVLRPKPWGWAQLLGAAMLSIYPLHFGLGVNIPVMAVLAFSLILMVASTVLNHFALKAPRTPPPPA
ncbi:hypothetical protein G3I60_04235 [Streptomyces sp. SID13666]|uniref:hypothetical protein n=1 Tax=Streptomyces TaxID=1883 RepID=UPI00110731ED|nr:MULTISPECIES: hypothetical protein [Streptomyces]MCZ4096893.1 hypothetical protein [Streptomyces sp. H39-C1]NEA53390.1 hypothetical protein [Streptomyces sp. SID13666]NEA69284.1 hypothetical protein [Streptomyces sp. SID13588]QNA70740.1 hypothetical protein C8250_001180 [Streptomyces sp. So13.3]